MTETETAMVGLESERLLVVLEAALAVKLAAHGTRLPQPLAAALLELDQLVHQLHIGAQQYVVHGEPSSFVSNYYAYTASRDLVDDDPSFYGLLMAAMRKADTRNAETLRRAFPEVWADLQARYDAPAGVLDTDPPALRARVLGRADA